MKKIILTIVTLACFQAYAGDSLDERLAEAEQSLKDAAQRLAELHAQRHEYKGQKKAMLGILLGPGHMVDGVDINGTTPKGGAVLAGLQAGDKIVVIDGLDLARVSDPLGTLSKHMKSVAPGDDVEVTYLRGKKRVDATITTQAHSAHIFSMIDGIGNNFDFDFDIDVDGVKSMKSIAVGTPRLIAVEGDLADYFEVEKGVVVTNAVGESELKGGDVLLSINGEDVTSVANALTVLAELDGLVAAKVKRKGRSRTVQLNPHEFHGDIKQEVKVIKLTTDD